MIDIRTLPLKSAHAKLVFLIDAEGRLFQRPLTSNCEEDAEGHEALPCFGDGGTGEVALWAVHSDGNISTELRVREVSSIGDLTRIELVDPEYPFFVDLCIRVYAETDVFETWLEVRHDEAGPVLLRDFASSALAFGTGSFWLTQFRGDWADEANMVEEPLTYGVKVLDSKLGVRAQQFRHPWFLLAKDEEASEDSGEVVGGSLAWSGSYAFRFEIDELGSLRAFCGMNPFNSEYLLPASETFRTPAMVWGWSGSGTGTLSRNLQRWSRKHALRDADRRRSIVLNNWEATYFEFDETKIVSLFDGAKELGMELFLLDDGWFGRKYPRNDDSQGLGDWFTNEAKLPDGLGVLATEASDRGLRFGIWLEPEMLNPKSELFEAHPDWAIQLPKRALDLKRNQLVLDLTRPEVEAFVYDVADRVLRENLGISYVKWDCNRYLTQPGSPFLVHQSHLWIGYVRALYRIFDRLAKEHPAVELMMCAGGGGRVDYGGMRYAHEFWPSDMTDPERRIFIQWGYSHFFPTVATSAHVTDMGNRPLKFAFDVAMSGRLGVDMDLDKLSVDERQFAKSAISLYKELAACVQQGTQYRLESPYAGPRSSLMYVEGGEAVVFVYSLGDAAAAPLPLKGLEPEATYSVSEINQLPGSAAVEVETTGGALTSDGLPIEAMSAHESKVFLLRRA